MRVRADDGLSSGGVSDIEEWRWADPNGQQRLVRTDELRAGLSSGMIPPNAPVWKRGWKEWQPAYSVPELTTSALSAVNGVIANIPPPPLGVLGAQKAMEQEAAGPRSARPGDVEPPAPPRYVASPTKISRPPGPTSSPPPPVHVAPDAPPPKIAEPIPETPAPAEVAGDHADTTVSPAMTDDEAERVVASAAAEPQTVATVMGIPALPLPRIPLTHQPN